MATPSDLAEAFKKQEWEMDEVSEDSFDRITFDALTYEICLDGSNVFYMELTELSPEEEILDGNLFKFEKDGSIVHIWSLSGMETGEVLETIVAFDKER